MRAIVLRGLGGRHRRGAGALVAFLGWHRMNDGYERACDATALEVLAIGIESFTFDAPLVNREPLRLPGAAQLAIGAKSMEQEARRAAVRASRASRGVRFDARCGHLQFHSRESTITRVTTPGLLSSTTELHLLGHSTPVTGLSGSTTSPLHPSISLSTSAALAHTTATTTLRIDNILGRTNNRLQQRIN